MSPRDPHLEAIVATLRKEYRCHTALLYGSRARGTESAISDYDVLGIRSVGAKTRLAKRVKGVYWDLVVYPEKDLKKLLPSNLHWHGAVVLFERDGYGQRLLRRARKLRERPFVPAPPYEIEVTLAWADKQLERIAQGGIHAAYRRVELLWASVEHYFQIQKLPYQGPKAALDWIRENDPTTFKRLETALKDPTDLRALKALVRQIYH